MCEELFHPATGTTVRSNVDVLSIDQEPFSPESTVGIRPSLDPLEFKGGNIAT